MHSCSQTRRKMTLRKAAHSVQFPSSETIRKMSTSFRRNHFWDCLGGQAIVKIGWWYSRQPLTNHKDCLSSQMIPEIVAPKACSHFPYGFRSGELWRFLCYFSLVYIYYLKFILRPAECKFLDFYRSKLVKACAFYFLVEGLCKKVKTHLVPSDFDKIFYFVDDEKMFVSVVVSQITRVKPAFCIDHKISSLFAFQITWRQPRDKEKWRK